MRIALVSDRANPLSAIAGGTAGGTSLHVAALAGSLASRGHRVRVFTRRDDPRLPDSVMTAGGYVVEHLAAGPAAHLNDDQHAATVPAFHEALRDRLMDESADLMHAHYWTSGIAAMMTRKRLGIPVAMTFHSLSVESSRHGGALPATRTAAEAILSRSVDRVIANCLAEVFDLRRMGLPSGQASVVACGVDVARFNPEGPTATRGAPHRIVVVSTLDIRGGIEDVVNALPSLPDTELVIAGGTTTEVTADPDARRIMALAARLGVAGRVVMLGRVAHRDVPDLLRSADVVVSPPWHQPFGVSVLEAMACGRPVVGAAVGGLRDTMIDGSTGFLVQPHRSDEIAAAVATLLADDDLRAKFGKAGRVRARSKYSWPSIAAATLSAYEKVLQSTPMFGRASAGAL